MTLGQGSKTAIGMVETSSIAKGFSIADAIIKAANVEVIVNRTVCPGKYMVMIGGTVDAVSSAVEAGVADGAHTIVDSFVIANMHPSVFPAINGVAEMPQIRALGVIEGFSAASVVEAADVAVKSSNVDLITVHLAMAIGGKAFVTMTGDVASIQTAVDSGANVIAAKGLLVEKVVIPAPQPEIVNQFI